VYLKFTVRMFKEQFRMSQKGSEDVLHSTFAGFSSNKSAPAIRKKYLHTTHPQKNFWIPFK
jgi:hypothetical protein